MGGSSGQVTGYRYYANFLLFIGNPIEKLLSINFDKRGWVPYNQFSTESMLNIDEAYMYGENEGGVFGDIDIYTGTSTQEVNTTYKNYMESIGLQASAYPYQSYLVFRGGPAARWTPIYGQPFYLGNSGYMKEMLLWPKRIHVRNDGSAQWYGQKAPIGLVDDYFEGEASQNFPLHTFYNAFGYLNEHIISQMGDGEGFYNDNPISPFADITFDNPGIGNSILKVETLAEFTKFGIIKLIQTVEMYAKELRFDEVFTGIHYVISENKITNTYNPGTTSGEKDSFIIERIIIVYPGFKIESKAEARGAVRREAQAPGYESLRCKLVTTVTKAVGIFYFYKNNPLDINPIHKIREILTDDTAMNKPESSVNDVNFVKAADRIFKEGLGISWSITEKSCIDAINELCYHIEAGIRVNRQTGLYEMVLFRDDWFEEDEIHIIAENKIKKGSMQYEITNADEVINQVNVNFYDRADIKNSSFSISESGLIQTLGRVNAETVDLPYFMNMRNAEIVANWKLKILSTGVLKGSFTTGWREARKWNRYDLIRLPWSKRWTGTILVRIMSIKLGGPTSNEVSIEWVEVVPSTGMMNTTIVADAGIDKPLPPQACQYEPFELPYYLAVMALGQRKADEELAYESNFGLVGTVAEKPQDNSLYAVMMTNNGDEWVRAGSIQYSAATDLDQIISKTSLSFTVKNWKRIANVPAGTLIKCGRDWLGTPGEWMVFQSIDPSTGIVSVKRGALDTQPQGWGEGTKLYFCGNDVSYDQTEYISGEEVLVSALTTTPSGVLEQKGSIPIEMKARAIRPYLPANVKFNDTYFPETLIVTNNIVLTWAHRNRMQQTGGQIIGWYDIDVTVENGVTYSYELISENVVLDSQSNIAANTVTILASVLKPNKPHTLKLWSVRDGYESYQKFEHSFFIEAASLILTATTNGSSVVGNTVPAANINVVVDESLSANMKFDGTSISGKAPAGSTITIEIEE